MELSTNEVDRGATEDQDWLDGINLNNLPDWEKEFLFGMTRWQVSYDRFNTPTGLPGFVIPFEEGGRFARIFATWKFLLFKGELDLDSEVVHVSWNITLREDGFAITPSAGIVYDKKMVADYLEAFGIWLMFLPENYDWLD